MKQTERNRHLAARCIELSVMQFRSKQGEPPAPAPTHRCIPRAYACHSQAHAPLKTWLQNHANHVVTPHQAHDTHAALPHEQTDETVCLRRHCSVAVQSISKHAMYIWPLAAPYVSTEHASALTALWCERMRSSACFTQPQHSMIASFHPRTHTCLQSHRRHAARGAGVHAQARGGAVAAACLLLAGAGVGVVLGVPQL